MKYPAWNNYCTTKKEMDGVTVTNTLLNESYRLPTEIVRFGKKLNGKTNPYNIDRTLGKAAVRNILETLEDCSRNRHIRTRLKRRVFGVLRLDTLARRKASLRVAAPQTTQKPTRLRSKNLF